MKTLTVTLADIEGLPHGSTRSHVKVAAHYSGEVVLTDGTIIPTAIREKPLSTDGVVEFDVYASDDPTVKAEYRGFAVIVTATVEVLRGQGKGASVRRTVKPLQAMASPISLGTLDPAEPLPPEWVTVAELTGKIGEAVAEQLGDTDSPAYGALVDAAGTVTGPQIAGQIDNPATETRSALAMVLGRYDIRLYGADLALADNGPAIQAAINAAAAAGGGVVWIPIGTWRIAAKTGRTISLAANVGILGQDRKKSIVKATATSDWAYLFCYPTTGACDNFSCRNLTIDAAGTTGMTGTASDWTKARTVFNLMGADIVIEGCDIICNGVWGIKHVGANARICDNDITVDMRTYAHGWFDQSIIWSNIMNGRICDNTFATKEATTSPFPVQTAVEFQGHRTTVSGNKGAVGTRFRNGIIFTANTYIEPLANFYPGWAKGADDNLIESNAFTVTRYGVEIWGMVVTDPAPIRGTRVRRNAITIDNTIGNVPGALLSMFIGTSGATGHDGTQTSPIFDLDISDNMVRYVNRRVSGVYSSADAAVRLYTEVTMTGVKVHGNSVFNCGGFGVLAYVAEQQAGYIDGLDITGNEFSDVREPVRIVRNVRNWRVENGNVFQQAAIYPNTDDNMIETVASRIVAGTDQINGVVRRNLIRCPSGMHPFYPLRDQNIAQSTYPASRGFVVEQMGVQMQAPTQTVTVGAADLVRRTDGTFAKAQYAAGATLGTLTSATGGTVTIGSVLDAQTMTVSDSTNLRPGQVVSLPFNAPFASGSAVVVAIVGSTVRVGANQLAAASGKSWSEAAGKTLGYYAAVTVVA